MRIIKNLLIIAVTASFAGLIIGRVHMETWSKIEKVNCIVHDPEIIANVKCGIKSLNWTYSLVNIRADITRVLRKLKVNIHVYKRYQLIYRPFLVNVTEDYCAFFKRNTGSTYMRMVCQHCMAYSNLNHSCPYYGEAIIKDLTLISQRLPLMPPDDYRLSVTGLEDRHKLITMEFYIQVKENDRSHFRDRSRLLN